MNLQESIRRILRESTFFRRRIDMRLVEKEFYENLNYATDGLISKLKKGIRFDFDVFKRIVIHNLMDDYHNDLSDGGLNDFPYDEVYDFLLNLFHDKIKDRYDLILRRNINESVPSQVKRRQQIFDDMFLDKRNRYISCNYRTPEYLFNGLLELTLEELYFGWFVDSVTYEEWEESVKFIENYLTEKYYDETSRMWESKCKGRLNESEDKGGKYISLIGDLTEIYKNEDCVCDIKIEHKPEEFRDLYLINVKVGNRDLDNKFNGIDYRIRNYLNQLRRKITEEVYDYLPIAFFVTFSDTPNCSDYKNLQESEEKKPSLLSLIEEHGLYEFMKMSGLSLPQIILKYDKLPREVFEGYIKDFLENDEIGWDLSIQISPNKIIDSFYISDDVVTIEVNEVDSIGRVVAGSFERLSVLSDEEIFSLVDEMSQINDDYLDYI